jgi:hypothetical protein
MGHLLLLPRTSSAIRTGLNASGRRSIERSPDAVDLKDGWTRAA